MSAAARGRIVLAVLLAVTGGLATAGGAAGVWVREEVRRDIGGVPVTEVETLGGMAVAPRLLPLGLAAALAGLGLLVARGRLQQGVAVVLLLAGVAAGALVGVGLLDLAGEGALGAGVAFAGLGAAGVVAAGVLGLRPARPATLPARYDLDADDTDDEWRIASDDEDGEDGR